MRNLDLQEMETIYGGNDFITGLCYGIGAGSVVYAAGALSNWWNPIGWVSVAFIAADAACVAYGIANS